MRTKYITAAVCGCVSGILSALMFDKIGGDVITWLPGAMFGWVFACFIMFAAPFYKTTSKYLVWSLFIALSTAAYYSAVYVLIKICEHYDISNSKFWLVGILSGFIGSLILVFSTSLCSFKIPSWRPVVLTILLGSVLGALVGYDSILKSYPLFVLWQTAVFVGLVSILPREYFLNSGENKS